MRSYSSRCLHVFFIGILVIQLIFKMSWLFGFRKEPPISEAPQIPSFMPPSTGDGSKGPGDSSGSGSNVGSFKMDAYRFDSAALERGAKAAKDLEASKYAKDVLELCKMQEMTHQMQHQNRLKELEAGVEQMRIEQIKIQHEERRKAFAEELKLKQQQSQYEDQLARKRYEDQLVQQQKMTLENLRQQEESIRKQEAMRRAALEHELELSRKTEMIKIETEMKAKAKMERENRDLKLEEIRVKAEEYRTTVLESIKTGGAVIGTGIKEFVSDWNRVSATAITLGLLTLGYYTAKTGTGVAFRFLEARLGKPSLTRETSRHSLTETLRHPIKTLKKLFSKPQDALKGNIHKPEMEERLTEIAIATRNTKKNRGTYKNLLLYGAPGTGKTLFAKSLSYHSGMDYALMTGGNAVTLGPEAPVAMNKLFDWASTSRRGLLLFIDEAGALFKPRILGGTSSDLQATFETFLLRTSEQSDRFMLVLSTNHPDQIDKAVHSRIDVMLAFDLPGLEERERLLRYFFEKHILKPIVMRKRFKVAQFDYIAKCSKIAKEIEGMSGRDIEKLALAWQDQAFLSADGILTEALIDKRVSEAIDKCKQQSSWCMEHLYTEKTIDKAVSQKSIPLVIPSSI